MSPDAVIAAAGLDAFPRSLDLEMAGGRAVYRIVDGEGGRWVLSADEGVPYQGFDAAAALDIARRFARAPAAATVGLVERDQWTVAGNYNGHRPLHLIRANDAAGTQVYVSSRTGEVVLTTDRRERLWNWAGSVPHWLYFTALRQNTKAWAQAVLWSSGLAFVGALAGLWLGFVRIRPMKRYPNGAASPYRGWMVWHHVAGTIGGVAVATWLVSGWLSMNPFGWLEGGSPPPGAAAAYAGARGPHHVVSLPVAATTARDVREARFVWVDGAPLIVLSDEDGTTRVLDAEGRAFRFPEARLAAAAQRLQPGAHVAFTRKLTDWDSYWYAHHDSPVLPVLRVGFDDPARTWVYIDPATGEMVGRTDSGGRAYRWLFSVMHSLDFGPLIRHRPAWDLVLWTLAILGGTVSVSGVVIGWRRLRRKLTPRGAAGPG
jgi:hypothetical protein